MKNLLKSALLFAALLCVVTITNAQTGTIEFEKTTHNFGANIPENGGEITCRFMFTNTGDAPVTIQNVAASCGCTTPAWTREPVAPGQQGFVDARYRPAGRPGNFAKNLTITNNGTPENIYLTITGTVVNTPVATSEVTE